MITRCIIKTVSYTHLDVYKRQGCYNLDGYLRITHALTLNDTFWVKPTDSTLKWDQVSLYSNEFDETIARIAFEGGMYGKQFSSTSPEFGKMCIRDSLHSIQCDRRIYPYKKIKEKS